MALNITFDGYCYLENGSLSNGTVKYQAYFYKGSTASSPSKWNDVRTVETGSGAGYYNFNLGDGDFLGQDGVALANSRVVIVFWVGGTRTGTDCSVLDEWGAFEIILDGSSTYTNPAQVKSNICPNLIWSFPTDGLINTNYSSTHNSNDIHSWNWSGTTMYHWYTRHSQVIHAVNTITNTDYYWGDGNSDENLSGVATGTHSWNSPGTYDINIVIEDVCGCTVTGTRQIEIRNRAPVPNIICHQAVGQNVETPDTVVTFEYSGTNPNNVITSIDWVIDDDTDTITNGHLVSDIIPHTEGEGTDWYGHPASAGAFTDPGGHQVSIVVHWWDGFTTQTINYSETFYQLKFMGPTVDFDQDPAQAQVGDPITFTNTSTDPDNRVGTGLPNGEDYDWRWTDDGVVENEADRPYSYQLVRTPGSTTCEVRLCANWQDGWDNQYTCTTKDVVFGTTITIREIDCYYGLNIDGTSSDGSVTDYSWKIFRSTSSGIGGPYEEIWSSPIGLNQKQKTICFTEQNYYRIIGYVYGYGAPTSDEEFLYVDEVCVSGTEGTVEYRYVAVCPPDMTAEEFGRITKKGKQVDRVFTGAKAEPDLKKPKMDGKEFKPQMKDGKQAIKPPSMRPKFPGPSNT